MENKVDALRLFHNFVHRNWLFAPEASFEDFQVFASKTPVFIAKPVDEMCGNGIRKINAELLTHEEKESLYAELQSNRMLLEECLTAHQDINLGTKGLSTFRIFTIIDNRGGVKILKAKYRAGVGEQITDTADGCIAYPVSIENGIIEGPRSKRSV